jgi:hypothetical protein
MKWACNVDHDCIKAVESVHPVTDFERKIQQDTMGGLQYPTYRVVLDRISGAILGYAKFQTNTVDIYDREGKHLTWYGRSEPSAATWFQPGDFIAGPIASRVGLGFSSSIGTRAVQSTIESEIADEVISGGVKDALAETISRETYRRRVLAAIRSTANHPLKFLLDEAGTKFKTLASRAHSNLIDNPDIWEAGHVMSNKLGGTRLMIQSAWENQVQNLTIERFAGFGVLDTSVVQIGGLDVARSTALWWEEAGFLLPGTVVSAPLVDFGPLLP